MQESRYEEPRQMVRLEMGIEELFRLWLRDQPEPVQRLAVEFPPATRISGLFTYPVWVLGWREEGDGVIVTPANPSVDAESAILMKRTVTPERIRRERRYNF